MSIENAPPPLCCDEMMADPVSPELRHVEVALDTEHLENPLLSMERSTAIWNLLSIFEEQTIGELFAAGPPKPQADFGRRNFSVNALKHALRWLDDCPSDGPLQTGFSQDRVEAAYTLLQLAHKYEPFATVYTTASQAACDLSLDGDHVDAEPIHEQKDPRYYAYNRLSVIKHVPAVNAAEVEEFLETADRMRVNKERFTVKLDPAYVKKLMKAQAEKIGGLFELPGDWETTRYTYGAFKMVFAALYAMCAARFRAHVIAIRKGVLHNGYRDGVLLAPRQDLTTLLTRYAQVSSSEVTAIVEDLTYKGRGIKNPDPALQPIVELHGDCLAIAPSVILSVSPERNLCVLMNRIPDEKKQYASLVHEKEELQRKEFLASPGCARYRSWAGSVPGRPDLPDVDLALVDDESKTVLICELKWFIGPDEVREVLDRNKDLEEGIREARALEDAFETDAPVYMSAWEQAPHTDASQLWFSKTGSARREYRRPMFRS
ncbi:MAG: hypothetical protein HY820_12050 [Acidobacteria bacterium]|nr:hypothetical protein [Acidobacteriota bacterium]